MSLICSFIIIALSAFVPFSFSFDQFRCKTVPGCEISRCDPAPLSWVHLWRNEFPISCISDKETTSNKEIQKLRDEMKGLASEISELRQKNENLENVLTATQKTVTELQEKNEKLENEFDTIKKRNREISDTLTPSASTMPTNSPIENEATTGSGYRSKENDGALPGSCEDVNIADAKKITKSGGVFDINVRQIGKVIEVSCDLTTDGGGWMVFQRRMDGSEDFDRGWDDYANGFGRTDREFWLGLENLHRITKSGKYELRIELGDFDGNTAYANYETFNIESAADNYQLNLDRYSGTAGNALVGVNRWAFSAKDNDNDDNVWRNCAEERKGAWWGCDDNNLNGLYHNSLGFGSNGVIWYQWKNSYEYIKYTEMKLRRIEYVRPQ